MREVAEGRADDTLVSVYAPQGLFGLHLKNVNAQLFEDHGKLDKVLAAFHEAIRMYRK